MARSLQQALNEISGTPFGPTGQDPAIVLQRFGSFFADFGLSSVRERLERTYAESAWFDDTLATIEGRAALLPYFEHTAQNVLSCRVELLHHAYAGVDLYVRWSMAIEFRRFRRGQVCQSVGMTHLRTDPQGLITLHQDYWDATRGFFEHVPLLGFGIRKIKARLG